MAVIKVSGSPSRIFRLDDLEPSLEEMEISVEFMLLGLLSVEFEAITAKFDTFPTPTGVLLLGGCPLILGTRDAGGTCTLGGGDTCRSPSSGWFQP